jgi:PAS domain S-box-containing protein
VQTSEQVEYNLKALDAILNSAHNGIIAVDEQGIITTINPAAERLTGCAGEKALGSAHIKQQRH